MSVLPILPDATIGVLGSGQLGRMFAVAARTMGYRIRVLSPESETPTGHLADQEVVTNYDNFDAVTEFAKNVDVVTFEFENIPVACINAIEQLVPVRPAGNVLHTTQQRLREKTFLSGIGVPVTPFVAIRGENELKALSDADFPAILKTAAWGYDGRGQVAVPTAAALPDAWSQLNTDTAILERFVDFQCELSVVAVRGSDGAFASYGPIRNIHRNHILDVSVLPSGVSTEIATEAVTVARAIVEALGVIGVLCVEFFLTKDGRLLVNELAPRPHNSGHLTIDAHVSSQFEQQVRSVCGLPLAATTPLRPVASANLLGDLWAEGEPHWKQLLEVPNLKLHLYGKKVPRPGRKMGHITVLADSPELAIQEVRRARGFLAPQMEPTG